MSTLHGQLHGFAAHLRDPQAHAPPPGIDPRRLAVYSDLFLANIRSLLASTFPVIRKTLGDARWAAVTRDFHARHRSTTPLFTRIGLEFIAFLEQREGTGADPPWLRELAHYEWAELALQLSDESIPAHDPGGDLLQGAPVLSPCAWALAYRWPVHAIAPDAQPDTPPDAPTLLLLRRDRAGMVHFSQLSPLVYRLLELTEVDSTRSGGQLLLALAHEALATDVNAFVQQGAQMLRHLRGEGTLLGTRTGSALCE